MNVPTFKSNVAEPLLYNVAQKVQLPPGKYRTAIERANTLLRHLERDDSPLRGLIGDNYPQGSIAIGAVVSSKFDRDEFDVDIVLQLAIHPLTAPGRVLDTLFVAIRGEPGSRYYKMAKRQTRCVTVEYDEMHIDFTPAVLLPERAPKISHIFHAHEAEPADQHLHIVANPWGFVEWVRLQTPEARYFAEAVLLETAAEVPDYETLARKSTKLIALQLIKRWRNKQYDKRRDVKKPPSVILSYYVFGYQSGKAGLLAELLAQARNLLAIFNQHVKAGRLIDARNPSCREDKFSDRWPGSMDDQKLFRDDLAGLVTDLEQLSADPTIEDCERIFARLFGERATQQVIAEFAERYSTSAHAGKLFHKPETGAVALRESGLSTLGASFTAAVPTRRHTNFGSGGSD